MKIHMYALAFCLAGFAACGDDDTNGNTDSGSDANVDDAQVNDATVEDAQVNDATVNDATIEDAQVNDATVEDAQVGYYTGDPDQCVGQNYNEEEAASEASAAASGTCLAVAADEGYRECVRDEVVDNVADIDNACAYCYGVSANCARSNCIGQCAGNPSSAACVTCRCTNGCYKAFDDCSGTTTSDADNCTE